MLKYDRSNYQHFSRNTLLWTDGVNSSKEFLEKSVIVERKKDGVVFRPTNEIFIQCYDDEHDNVVEFSLREVIETRNLEYEMSEYSELIEDKMDLNNFKTLKLYGYDQETLGDFNPSTYKIDNPNLFWDYDDEDADMIYKNISVNILDISLVMIRKMLLMNDTRSTIFKNLNLLSLRKMMAAYPPMLRKQFEVILEGKPQREVDMLIKNRSVIMANIALFNYQTMTINTALEMEYKNLDEYSFFYPGVTFFKSGVIDKEKLKTYISESFYDVDHLIDQYLDAIKDDQGSPTMENGKEENNNKPDSILQENSSLDDILKGDFDDEEDDPVMDINSLREEADVDDGMTDFEIKKDYRQRTAPTERIVRSLTHGLVGPVGLITHTLENVARVDIFGRALSGKFETRKPFRDTFSFKDPDNNIIFNYIPPICSAIAFFIEDENPKLARMLTTSHIIVPIMQNIMSGRSALDYGYKADGGNDLLQLGVTAIPFLIAVGRPIFNKYNKKMEEAVTKMNTMNGASIVGNSGGIKMPKIGL